MAARSRIPLPLAATIIVLGVIAVFGLAARYVINEWLLPMMASAHPATAVGRDTRPWTRTYRDPILDQIADYRSSVRRLIEAQDFAQLDAMAATARTGKLRFANGSWQIYQFYSSLEPAPGDHGAWEKRYQKLLAWKVQSPRSVTARIAVANFLTGYAWEARGSGWANTVTKEGWELFRKRLEASWSELEAAENLPEKDPHWYSVALTVALGQQWSGFQAEQMFNRAAAFQPDYFNYYNQRAKFLLPRWYGREGDWEAFAADVATKPGGAELYARIMIEMDGYHDQLFKQTHATWAQTKPGLVALVARYPDSSELISHAAMLACCGDDRAYARELFTKLGERIDQRVWRSVAKYEQYHNYAFR